MSRFKYDIVAVAMVLVGLSCNLLVTHYNGGMPAKINYAVPSKNAYDILKIPYPKYTALYDGTKLKFLADIFPFDFSIGDILMIAGLALLAALIVIRLSRVLRFSRVITNKRTRTGNVTFQSGGSAEKYN